MSVSKNTEEAYKFIRSKILSGNYRPGYAINTKLLSQEIGVSRTPIRDALRQLETDGLIVIRPRLGATVKKMALQEFKDLCGLRQALESYAAGLAAVHRTDAELAEIGGAIQSMKALLANLDGKNRHPDAAAELAKEDVRFHVAIMTASKNVLLKKEIIRLQLINRVVVGAPAWTSDVRESTTATLKEHTDIYLAIEAKNVNKAKAAMEYHIQDIIDQSIKIMGVEETTQISSEFGI